MFRPQHPRLSVQRCLLLSFLLLGVSIPSTTCAQDFKVGDRVELDFMGGTQKGEVTGIFGTGWPIVRFTYRGRVREMPQPPGDLRKIGPAKSKLKSRTWNSKNGKSKIKATMIGIEDDKVRLKKTDGKEVSVPIDKLSAGDQGYIEAMRETLGEGNISDKTSSSSPSSSQRGRRRPSRLRDRWGDDDEDNESPSSSALSGLPEASTHSMQPVVLTPNNSWELVPDRSAANPIANPEIISVSRGDSKTHAIHDRITCVVSVDGTGMALSVSNPFGHDGALVRTYDLEIGKELGSLNLGSEHMGVRSVGSHGELVVTANDTFFRQDHIAIWSPKNGVLESAGGWIAPKGRSSGVDFVHLLSSDKLVAGNRSGAVFWDIPKHRGLASLPMSIPRSPVAMSANNKHMVVVREGSAYLIDNESEKRIATIDLGDLKPNLMSISDSGTYLAGYGDDNIRIWSLKDGSRKKDIWLLQDRPARSMDWIGNKFLLLNQSILIDIRLAVTAWEFESHKVKTIVKGAKNQFWYVHYDSDGGSIVPILLPPSSIEQACDEYDPADLDWHEPGPISLEIGDLTMAPHEVRSKLTERLEDIGYTINQGAPMVLSMRVERGKTQTEGVRDWFESPFGKPNETITFTPTTSFMELTRNGKVIWKRVSTNTVPRTINLKRGESAQQAATRLCKPKPEFFTNANIPRKGFLFPNGKLTMGRSTLGPRGLQ